MSRFLDASDGLVLDLNGEKLSVEVLEQLREEIHIRNITEFKHVYLNGCSLNISCLNIVMDILTSHLLEVETLHLKSNSLSKDTGLFMAKLLISTGRLRTIDMSENSLGDIGVASVAGAFTVDISHLELNKTISLLSLTTLNLAYNSFGDAAVLALCRGLTHFSRHCAALGRPPALKVLNLSGNKLGDKSAQCLGQLLVSLSSKGGGLLSLDEIVLNNNPISSVGINALLGCLTTQSLGAPSVPPLKILSLDQCYPNITVLNAIGKCCLLQVKVHFTEADAIEAVQSIHLKEALMTLLEDIKVNSHLSHVYLGHLPSVVEMELNLIEDKSSLDYEDLHNAFEILLAIADTIHLPMTVTEFNNKELRTPKHALDATLSLPSSISFDALEKQRLEYDQLRNQHKSVLNKLADEVQKLAATDPLLESATIKGIEPPNKNNKIHINKKPVVADVVEVDVEAYKEEAEEEAVEEEDTDENSRDVIAEEGTENVTVSVRSLSDLIRSAVQEALNTSSSTVQPSAQPSVQPSSHSPVLSSAAHADKLMLLTSRLDILEGLLRTSLNQQTESNLQPNPVSDPTPNQAHDRLENRVQEVEERLDMLEYRIEELLLDRERLASDLLTIRVGDRRIELPALAVQTSQRLDELERAVETEHEFSLRLLDLLLNQKEEARDVAKEGVKEGGRDGAKEGTSEGAREGFTTSASPKLISSNGSRSRGSTSSGSTTAVQTSGGRRRSSSANRSQSSFRM